jgi:hypothetical protein
MKRPTLKYQIEQTGAPSGSALEKMIRDNQDFNLLATEELEDDYPIPLWLRVAYRKQHPEIPFPSKNPGAAYPEGLYQVYKRMVANPNEPWGGAATKNPPSPEPEK